jgi:transposase
MHGSARWCPNPGQRRRFVSLLISSIRRAVQAQPRPPRASKQPFDKALYKERHLIECFFSKLKPGFAVDGHTPGIRKLVQCFTLTVSVVA